MLSWCFFCSIKVCHLCLCLFNSKSFNAKAVRNTTTIKYRICHSSFKHTVWFHSDSIGEKNHILLFLIIYYFQSHWCVHKTRNTSQLKVDTLDQVWDPTNSMRIKWGRQHLVNCVQWGWLFTVDWLPYYIQFHLTRKQQYFLFKCLKWLMFKWPLVVMQIMTFFFFWETEKSLKVMRYDWKLQNSY